MAKQTIRVTSDTDGTQVWKLDAEGFAVAADVVESNHGGYEVHFRGSKWTNFSKKTEAITQAKKIIANA